MEVFFHAVKSGVISLDFADNVAEVADVVGVFRKGFQFVGTVGDASEEDEGGKGDESGGVDESQCEEREGVAGAVDYEGEDGDRDEDEGNTDIENWAFGDESVIDGECETEGGEDEEELAFVYGFDVQETAICQKDDEEYEDEGLAKHEGIGEGQSVPEIVQSGGDKTDDEDGDEGSGKLFFAFGDVSIDEIADGEDGN